MELPNELVSKILTVADLLIDTRLELNVPPRKLAKSMYSYALRKYVRRRLYYRRSKSGCMYAVCGKRTLTLNVYAHTNTGIFSSYLSYYVLEAYNDTIYALFTLEENGWKARHNGWIVIQDCEKAGITASDVETVPTSIENVINAWPITPPVPGHEKCGGCCGCMEESIKPVGEAMLDLKLPESLKTEIASRGIISSRPNRPWELISRFDDNMLSRYLEIVAKMLSHSR
jgi:hypothetical protein